MDLASILAIIQAAAALLPQLQAAVGPAERLISGTGTAEDVAALEALAASLNATAEAAESRAGADAPGE